MQKVRVGTFWETQSFDRFRHRTWTSRKSSSKWAILAASYLYICHYVNCFISLTFALMILNKCSMARCWNKKKSQFSKSSFCLKVKFSNKQKIPYTWATFIIDIRQRFLWVREAKFWTFMRASIPRNSARKNLFRRWRSTLGWLLQNLPLKQCL